MSAASRYQNHKKWVSKRLLFQEEFFRERVPRHLVKEVISYSEEERGIVYVKFKMYDHEFIRIYITYFCTLLRGLYNVAFGALSVGIFFIPPYIIPKVENLERYSHFENPIFESFECFIVVVLCIPSGFFLWAFFITVVGRIQRSKWMWLAPNEKVYAYTGEWPNWFREVDKYGIIQP